MNNSDKLNGLYHKLFSSPEGQIILEDLEKKTGANKPLPIRDMDDKTIFYNLGRQDLVKNIKQIIKEYTDNVGRTNRSGSESGSGTRSGFTGTTAGSVSGPTF